jgi:uncharacterized membrane protein YhiD involved in acid resistance
MNIFPLSADALNLLASFAIGFLIGIERGWSQRQRNSGERVAGLRTFSLAGLLGGVLTLVSGPSNVWILSSAIVGLSLLLVVAYFETARTSGDLSITTAVALLLTLLLGAAAMLGHVALALAAAVLVAILLNLKSTLHHWHRPDCHGHSAPSDWAMAMVRITKAAECPRTRFANCAV